MPNQTDNVFRQYNIKGKNLPIINEHPLEITYNMSTVPPPDKLGFKFDKIL